MLPKGLPPVLSLAVSADQFCLPVMLKICIEADLRSGLPPKEAPVMIAEKRKLFFSFSFLRPT